MRALGQHLDAGDSVSSDWFPRQGDNCIVYWEVIDAGSGGNLVVTIYHKDPEDTSQDGAVPGTSSAGSQTNAGRESSTANGLLELVKLKFAASTAAVQFRVLGITWYNDSH